MSVRACDRVLETVLRRRAPNSGHFQLGSLRRLRIARFLLQLQSLLTELRFRSRGAKDNGLIYFSLSKSPRSVRQSQAYIVLRSSPAEYSVE